MEIMESIFGDSKRGFMEEFKVLAVHDQSVRQQISTIGRVDDFDNVNQNVEVLNEVVKNLPVDSFSLCLDSNGNYEERTPWWRLEQTAQYLVRFSGLNNAIPTLRSIQDDWLKQGPFSLCTATELLAIHSRVETVIKTLDRILLSKHSLSKLAFNDLCDQAEKNKRLASKYLQNIISAIEWKLKASILANDLHNGDSLACLKKELSLRVFSDINTKARNDIDDLLQVSYSELSYDFNFQLYVQALRVVRPNKLTELFQQLVSLQNEAFPIKLHNNMLVPTSLASQIPTYSGWTRGSYIQYWFFHNSIDNGEISAKFRKWWVGVYENTAVLIRETMDKISKLEEVYNQLEENEYLSLDYLENISAFRCANEIMEFIDREEARCDYCGEGYRFINQWKHLLLNARSQIQERCGVIAENVAEDYKWFIVDAINQEPYAVSVPFLNYIKRFVELYGSNETKLKLQEVSSPITIVKEFKAGSLSLKQKTIYQFGVFSKQYWGSESRQAIKRLINLILKRNIPTDENEEANLFETISPLLTSEDPKVQFEEFLGYLATDVYSPTGDDGSEELLSFMERHYPECATQFRNAREHDADKKFQFILHVLSCGPELEYDLTGNEGVCIEGILFHYNLLNKYLRDIYLGYSNLTLSQNNQLISAAKVYVEQYSGTNLKYADLIRVLSKNFAKSDLFQSYIAKHFSWLIEHAVKNPLVKISKKEHQFYQRLSDEPAILSRIIEVINTQYSGNSIVMNKIIDNLQNDELTITYYLKRIEYLCSNFNFNTLLMEINHFTALNRHHAFGARCHAILGNTLKAIVTSNRSQYLNSENLLEIIEQIGSVQNIESYRLLRIKGLLSNQEYEETYDYINRKISHFMQLGASEQLLMLPDTTALLSRIFKNHFENELPETQWSGHTQYFLELFIPAETQKLLYALRLRWLELFLFYPEQFNLDDLLKRSPLDCVYHYQNLMIPNERATLDSYFFMSNIDSICELLSKRLDNFDPFLPEPVVTLLSRYINDPAIRSDRHYSVLSRKLYNVQEALKIVHHMQLTDFDMACYLLQEFYIPIRAKVLQEDNALDSNSSAVLQHQLNLFNSLCDTLLDCYKHKVIAPHLSHNLEELEKVEWRHELSQQANFVLNRIRATFLTKAFTIALNDFEQKQSTWCRWFNAFYHNLEFDRLHLLKFTADDALMASVMLSKTSKQAVQQKGGALISSLLDSDPLKASLQSFLKVMNEGKMSTEQKESINSVSTVMRNYPQLAIVLQSKLLSAMKNSFGLAPFVFLCDSSDLQLNRFIQHLDEEHTLELKFKLLEYIEHLYQHFSASELISLLREWKAAGRLFHGLDICFDLKVKESLGESQRLFNQIWKDCHIPEYSIQTNDCAPLSLPSPDILLAEKLILKNLLFVQTFGNESSHARVTKIIDEVLKRSRKLLMQRLIGPLSYYSIDFANKLMLVAGNANQKNQYRHLLNSWNCIQEYNRNSFVMRYENTLDKAIEQYTSEVAKSLFQYFVNKFNLSYDPVDFINSKGKEWGLDKTLIEPEDISNRHPVEEFKVWLDRLVKASDNASAHGVTERDACKLYVAFCVSSHAIQLGKMWLHKVKLRPELQTQFPLHQVRYSLNNLVERLREQFDIGQGQFNQALIKVVSQDRDYFARWAAIRSEEASEDEEMGLDSVVEGPFVKMAI